MELPNFWQFYFFLCVYVNNMIVFFSFITPIRHLSGRIQYSKWAQNNPKGSRFITFPTFFPKKTFVFP